MISPCILHKERIRGLSPPKVPTSKYHNFENFLSTCEFVENANIWAITQRERKVTKKAQIVKCEAAEDEVIRQKPKVKQVSRKPKENYVSVKLEIQCF